MVELNNWVEVMVNTDQSTAVECLLAAVEGLLAAGEVADIEEKQISIAVDQGALAP